MDFRNNVIYNWMNNNIYGGERGRYNLVNNYLKPGPATKAIRSDQIVNPWSPYGKFFVSGNFLFGNEMVTSANHAGVKADLDSVLTQKEFPVPAIGMHSAEKSYLLVLATAGASHKRDAVDQRIVDEVRKANSVSGKNKNGIIDSQEDVGGWPDLKSLPPKEDKDQDGMPDAWEQANRLNPKDAADACKRTISKEYDNIEVYLNDLVEYIINAQAGGSE